MSAFWSLWIIVLTTLTIVGISWILFANRKTRGDTTDTKTGHTYDGIDEYDNPLPAWWFYMFVITIVFALGYLVAFPGLGTFKGILNWSSAGQLEKDIAKADAQYGPLFAKFASMPITEVAKDPQALKMGQRLFATNCAQCHGADARGSFGFPNLTDNDWLYGGEPEQIEQTITHGRNGAMPAWESALGNQGVLEVANYVVTLNGRSADEKLAQAGKEKFAMYCVGCHGADGKGNQQLGAPNLTDDVWLYGGSPLMIQQTVRGGRNNMMPAWLDRLGKERVHLLAAYVYSLSHTQ
ncbi:MAG TPA: cytochrome-c oxidase, cbb3-type subunit III [Spongiibacteraceae bacterium]|nr:cytochrome-c oxidase, cbb3-type subunit III [Spongiibacteraceae bacterium]